MFRKALSFRVALGETMLDLLLYVLPVLQLPIAIARRSLFGIRLALLNTLLCAAWISWYIAQTLSIPWLWIGLVLWLPGVLQAFHLARLYVALARLIDFPEQVKSFAATLQGDVGNWQQIEAAVQMSDRKPRLTDLLRLASMVRELKERAGEVREIATLIGSLLVFSNPIMLGVSLAMTFLWIFVAGLTLLLYLLWR